MPVTQYRSYYRLFTLKFVLRAFFVRLLRLYAREVKQLDIADQLIARRISVQKLKGKKIKLAIDINDTPLNVLLRKNTSDLLVFDQVLLKRAYHPLVELVRRHFHGRITTIVDVGGNIGLTSLYFRCYFEAASIFVIEPSQSVFPTLVENLKANGVNGEPYQKALLATKGRVKTDHSFRDKQDWSTQVIPTDSALEIEAVSLADFRYENPLPVIDILKIDIEGHEAELFMSTEFLAELKSVRFIAIEVHEEKADRISVINELQNLGFILSYKGETIFGFNPAAL